MFEHCVTIISTRDYRIANTLLGGIAVFVFRSLRGLECLLPSPSRSEMESMTLESGISLQKCPKIFSNSRQRTNLPCFLCWPWRRWRPSQRPRWAASWRGRRGAGGRRWGQLETLFRTFGRHENLAHGQGKKLVLVEIMPSIKVWLFVIMSTEPPGTKS